MSDLIKHVVENAKNGKFDDKNALTLIGSTLSSSEMTDKADENGILDLLIEYMNSPDPETHHDATLLLVHIALNSTKMMEIIAKKDAVPLFFKNLNSSNKNILSTSLMFFNSIVFSHPDLRKYVNEFELVQHIHIIVESNPSINILEYSLTVFLSLTQCSNPPLSHEAIKAMLPVFSIFLQHPHPEIAGNSALALALITSNKNSGYMIMFEEEDIQNLIELLNRRNKQVQISALRLILYIIDNSDHETQVFIDKGILQSLTKFLKGYDDETVMLALLIVQKLITSSNVQITTIFNSNIVPLIAENFISTSSVEVQQVAAIIFSNIAINGNENQVSMIIDMNVIPTFCNLLKKREHEILIHSSLIAILTLLQKSENRNCFIFNQLSKCGGFVALEKLENYETANIKKFASSILSIYEQQSIHGTCQKEVFM
uniref:Uncharacterized protein n=1 Tax=Panagrolaimus sp. ES5 TaxID=591445 RepID=A0AC34G5G3_9BILA